MDANMHLKMPKYALKTSKYTPKTSKYVIIQTKKHAPNIKTNLEVWNFVNKCLEAHKTFSYQFLKMKKKSFLINI